MGALELYDYQWDAIKRMKDGCILCGGVGSGKSRTALAYYFMSYGGELYNDYWAYTPMMEPADLYIITTARKRDTLEWDHEMLPFLLTTNPETNYYKNKVIIDSWNNIGKYKDVTNAFFIFDEQRVVGKGAWVKSFLKICKSNRWILLSATPGDTWTDYVPVFIANGFYSNRSEFNDEHVEFDRFTKFPKVKKYHNEGRLIRLRNNILVTMQFERKTVSHNMDIWCDYDHEKYHQLYKTRWNPDKNEPISSASELCYALRKVVNSDESRFEEALAIAEERKKCIIFYNFDYELDGLKHIFSLDGSFEVAEWNGHAHEAVPDGDKWIYLVQYTAGCEGWNCITTDSMIFFSQNYSYKVMEQASGRINRLNTMYRDLYYYHLKSRSGIDLGINRAILSKKKFNEGAWVNGK